MCPPARRARLRRQCLWMVCSARSSRDTSSSRAHRNAMYLQHAPVSESRCYMEQGVISSDTIWTVRQTALICTQS